MDIEVFSKGIFHIAQHFGGNYPSVSQEDIWPDCQQEPDDAMRQAFKRLRVECNHLPTLAKIRDTVKEEGYKLRMAAAVEREEEAKREKEQFRQATAKALKDSDKIASRTVTLVRGAMAGAITREKLLEGIRRLDSLYPHAGFASEGAKLQAFYEQRDLKMNENCGGVK